MHRQFSRPPGAAARLPILIGLVVLALCAMTVRTADAQPQRGSRSTPVAVTPSVDPVPVLEPLRLACAHESVNGQRGILCQWAPATNPHTRGYDLYRSVDGSPRQLVASVGAEGRLAFLDTEPAAPAVVVYGIVSLNAAGRTIGVSSPQQVVLVAPVADLRFACNADSLAGVRGVLCRWSEGPRARTEGYLLFRQVGDRPREIIARVGTDGRLAHFDRDLVTGATHTYAVVAIDGAGAVVANGGPSRIIWPVGG